jgi:hypothetical protein
MTPFLSREMAEQHIADLRREAARAGGPSRAKAAVEGRLTVRRFQERDIDAIWRLAQLDSRELPTGAVLLAELGGELVAALPLDGGPALADPFRPTASIVEILRLRASQLRAETRSPLRSWLGIPAWLHHAA